MKSYTIQCLVDDLRASYGSGASSNAIALMIAARQRGMSRERDAFTSAAILLCRAGT